MKMLKRAYILILIFFGMLLLPSKHIHAAKKHKAKIQATDQKAKRKKEEKHSLGFLAQLKRKFWGPDKEEETASSRSEEENSIPGLENLGQSCYFNATMQCLASLEPLTTCLAQHAKKKGTCRQTYLYLVNQMNNQENLNISPKELYKKITAKLGWKGHQQDAEEFYSALMQRLFKNLSDNGKTQLHQTIYPTYQTTFWDIQTHSSIKIDTPSPLIFLEITKNEPTLENCLNNYFGEERFTHPNQWNCELCGLTDAQKQLQMISFPEILTLQLKRFQTDDTGKITEKNRVAIRFPMNLKIRAAWVHGLNEPQCPSYDLVGIVIHGGTLNGGHYWSYTKRFDQWHYCNDSSTRTKTDEEIETIATNGLDNDATPYLLFYQKRNIAVATPRRTHKAK